MYNFLFILEKRYKTVFMLVCILTLVAASSYGEPVDDKTTKHDKSDFSLKVNLGFSANSLPEHTRIWYERMWRAIKNPKQYPNVTNLSAATNGEKGGTYDYGRPVNVYITTLLSVLRITGDPAILDEIDRITQNMRSKLNDWSLDATGKHKGARTVTDGFLNWLYLRPKEPNWHDGDYHLMDDILTHAMIAEVAYAFRINGDASERYVERANFWTDYLKNHFELKWRKRLGIAAGPFLEKNLMHVYVHIIRYYYYMYLLTRDIWYLEEVKNNTEVVKGKMCLSNNGTTYVWTHGVAVDKNAATAFCQPFIYAQYTVMVIVDLTLEGFTLFDNEFMTKVSSAIKYNIIDNGDKDFAPDVCGGRSVGLLRPSGYSRENRKRWAVTAFTLAGAWDLSRKIIDVSRQVYANIEKDVNEPNMIYIPAGIFFSLRFQEQNSSRAGS